mgnify:CR=1 FL=1
MGSEMCIRDSFKDIEKANSEKKTAIFFGFQNCSPIEDDIGLVEKVHELGCRFMQLTYNNQSLLATGCYEKVDSGVTNFGREVIKEMNRVGVVVDMSHSAEKSTLDAIELSEKPIAITHANPSFWHAAKRNKSPEKISMTNMQLHHQVFSSISMRSGSSHTMQQHLPAPLQLALCIFNTLHHSVQSFLRNFRFQSKRN